MSLFGAWTLGCTAAFAAGARMLAAGVGDPRAVAAFWTEQGGATALRLANLTAAPVIVRLPRDGGRQWTADERNAWAASPLPACSLKRSRAGRAKWNWPPMPCIGACGTIKRVMTMERPIEWRPVIDSTMRRAAELARAGAPAGAIVGADEQTAGQGRMGRRWHSPPGGGLYFTMILRPRLRPEDLPLVTLALGLAVADAIQMFTGLPCDLRWPNDVLANDRKIAGILAQMQDGAILAGIGVNVNQADFPADLRDIATSIIRETGTEYDKHFLLRAIAGGIESHVKILESSGAEAILRLFAAASSYVTGRRVAVELPTGEVRGVTAGLTSAGCLLLRTDAGEEITITAGGVRPAG